MELQPQQKYTCPMHPEIVQDTPGRCPKCGMNMVPAKDEAKASPSHGQHEESKSPLTAAGISTSAGTNEHDKMVNVELDKPALSAQKYTCPMHPHIMQDAPGKCPLCGMTLEPVASDSHGKGMHTGIIADFKKRFYVVLALTIPIMLLSEMIQQWLNLSIDFPGSKYVLLAMSSVVFFYGGWPFLKGLVDEARVKNPGMMFLIGFAISVAYIYSVATVFGLQGMDFFWELATLILIMLLGHWIEMKSVAGASRELELLVQLMPDDAHLVQGETITDVKTATLKAADVVLVKPGEKVAADGIIVDGESYLNESMLTGESKPVQKTKGDKVIAGAINGNGSIKVTVSHATQDSYLSQVVKLVSDAQKSKSKTQLLADTAAKWLTAIAIVAGIGTFLFWYLTGQSLAFAMERMVTVIVICCPHALGLAVPLVVAKSTAISAKNGLLIKNRTAFENARKITTIVFDKTGTLTIGKFLVSKIVSLQKIYLKTRLFVWLQPWSNNLSIPLPLVSYKSKRLVYPNSGNRKL